MANGGFREKGPAWERAACGKLSMWVSDLQRQDIFWRSSQSGGRSTFRTKMDTARERMGQEDCRKTMLANQAGDISAIDPMGSFLTSLFVIECKFWKDMEFQKWVFGKTGTVNAEWEKVQRIAAQTDRAAMMLAKQNRIGEICGVDSRGREILLMGLDDPRELTPQAIFPFRDMWVYLFRDVLVDVNYEKLKEAYEAQSRLADRVAITIEED